MPITSLSEPAADAFRAEVREWIRDSIPPGWREKESRATEEEFIEVRREWDRKLYAGGYAGLSWPSEYGGQGRGIVEEVIFAEECARASAPEGLGRIGRNLVGPLLIEYGSEDQKDRYLRGILSGEELWCQGYSEPDAGSDLPALKLQAVRADDTYSLYGTKIWTSYAHYADRCFLLARTGRPEDRYENISIFLVNLDQPGLQINPIVTAAGDHHFNEVVFDGATVSTRDRLGNENGGWPIVRASLVHERGTGTALGFYTEMSRECGILRDCCAADAELKEVAALTVQTELVRWYVLRLAELRAAGVATRRGETSVLKLYWSELWLRLTKTGMGLSCPVHAEYWWYQYLQALSATIHGGTSEIQKNTIARQLMSDT